MTDSAIKYVGVDGCKAGWIGVGLDDAGSSQVNVCGKFGDLLTHFGDACVVLVDMPIGLSDITHDETCTKRRSPCDEIARICDKEARDCLGSPRSSSVFTTPPRPLVNKVIKDPTSEYEKANRWLKEQLGCKRGITRQAYNIIPKINEVEKHLETCGSDSPTIREAHPEVCFMALSKGNQPMSQKKSTRKGVEERRETLRHCARHVDGLDVGEIYEKARREYTKSQVADDDILDALILAITAKLGCQNGFRRLPEDLSHDCKKPKPPEMVYYAIPNEK